MDGAAHGPAVRPRRRPPPARRGPQPAGRPGAAQGGAGLRGYVCPECGLEYDSVSPRDAAAAVRSYPRRYRGLLAAPGPVDPDAPDHVIRRRPHPSTWSALEYAAHVADRLDHLGPAIRAIARENEPTITLFDNEARASAQRYNELPVAEVLGWLDLACADLAAIIESTAADDWTRTGHLPTGDRTALDVARDAVHEGSHHLRDVQRALAAVRGRRPEKG